MLYYFKINENVEHFMQVTYPPITVCYRQSNNLINTYTNLKSFLKRWIEKKTNNNDHGKTEAKAQHAKVEGRIIP